MITQYNSVTCKFFKAEISYDFWNSMDERICKTKGWVFEYAPSDAYLFAQRELRELLRQSLVIPIRVTTKEAMLLLIHINFRLLNDYSN